MGNFCQENFFDNFTTFSNNYLLTIHKLCTNNVPASPVSSRACMANVSPAKPFEILQQKFNNTS